MDWLKALQEFFESFKATPVGIAILFILFVVVVLLLLIWVKIVQSSDKQNERETELEKLRLKNQQEDDQRKALNDARMVTAVENTGAGLQGIRSLLDRVIAIEQRIETKLQGVGDMTRDTKSAVEAVSIRAERIYTDVRTSAVKLADKVDHANKESASRWENTQIVINNRAQETQKTMHSVGENIQTALTGQNTVLDQVLNQLVEVNGKLAVLSADFQRNTNAQTAATEQKASELSLLTNIQASLRDIMNKVESATRKGTGELNPSVVDPIARPTITNVANVPPPVPQMPTLTHNDAEHPTQQLEHLKMPPSSTGGTLNA